MKASLKNTLILSVLAYVIFWIITLIYFKPEVIDGLSLRQDDMIKYKGMIHDITEYQKKSGEISMWAGAMFSGMPAQMLYPVFSYGPLPFVESFLRGFFAESSGAHLLFLSIFCTYLMLLCFRIHPILAIGGAIAFGLTTYNLILIDVGHVTKLWAISYAALIIGGLRVSFQGKNLLGFAIVALGMALEIKAAHYQITYYLAFGCAFYVLSEAYFQFKNQLLPSFIKSSLWVGAALFLGVSVNAGKILTTLEYTPYSTRGASLLEKNAEKSQGTSGLDKEYAFDWSQGKMETLTLLIPNLYGGSSHESMGEESAVYQALGSAQAGRDKITIPTYWGDQPFTAGPIYAGAILCFLFILGIAQGEKREVYWLVAAALWMMFLAWGRNFSLLNDFLFDYFPGFNKFRSVSMALSLTILFMVPLAMQAVQRFFEAENPENLLDNKWKYSLIGTAGFCLLIALGAGMIDVSSPIDAQLGEMVKYVFQDRVRMLRGDAFRSMLFILLTGVTFYLYAKSKVFQPLAFIGIVCVLLALDNGWIGKRYLNNEHFDKNAVENMLRKSEADDVIMQDTDKGYRVLNLNNPFNDSKTSYFHRSVGGYFAAKMRTYQDLISVHLNNETQGLVRALQSNALNEKTTPVLNMLNTRYFKYNDQKTGVLENPFCMGSAWFVSQIKKVENADSEIESLGTENLKTTAVFSSKNSSPSKNSYTVDSLSRIELVEYVPNRLKYTTSNSHEGLAVLSEIYFPIGWSAFLDGKEIPILNCNYVLRAVEIPSGQHSLELRYESPAYEKGKSITLVTSFVLTLLVFGALGLTIFNSYSQKSDV